MCDISARTCLQGEPRTDLTTLAGASRMDNIRAIYGAEVARELSVLELSEGPEPGPGLGPEDGIAFRAEVGRPSGGEQGRTGGGISVWITRVRWGEVHPATMMKEPAVNWCADDAWSVCQLALTSPHSSPGPARALYPVSTIPGSARCSSSSSTVAWSNAPR